MGVVAGMRSQLPFFMLSRAARDGAFASEAKPPLGWLKSTNVQRSLGFAAIVEMIGDKLPFVPNRTSPGPLIGRLSIGAASGAAMASDAKLSALHGALAGGGGALAASFVGMYGRFLIGKGLGVPDLVVALVEDGLALELGRRAAELSTPEVTAGTAGAAA